MYKNLLLISLATALTASANLKSSQLNISDLAVNQSEAAMTVNMTVDPAPFKVKSNNMVVLTPAIVAQKDTLRLPAVTIAGRNAWFQEVRNNQPNPSLLRAGKKTPLNYSATVPYQPWMQQSNLVILTDTLSECNCFTRSGHTPVIDMDFTPEIFVSDNNTFEYLVPSDTIEKVFNLSGRANIIFKVNRTDIDWTYKSNYAELDSILASINAVKDNKDATVEQIMLTGYASPEGSYANNERLAQGRTAVVRKYVADHSSFPSNIYKEKSVAEDWAGLRQWLTTSTVPEKKAIIELIDDKSIPVEKKNDVLRQRYPETYRFLLANVYPNLRHTDYVITYKIRRYYDVEEIAAVMQSNPRNLSLNEFFLLANSYEKGSVDYDSVFLTAARLFPNDDIANMNAAYSAINQGELNSARLFLSRIEPSPQTAYAWGVLYAKEGNYAEALEMLKQAKDGGVEMADVVIERVEKAMKPAKKIKLL
ncbi:MAG: DUF3868 domain-containing protein [Muribaculaceae bacterium]|nr:DUF3868 domain-containing protein [Muribaculaceae bacterium]